MLIGIIGASILVLVNGSAFVLSPLAVCLAFGFAAGIGVISGYSPARRAAK